MKCPYNNFSDCKIQECPACEYEERKIPVLVGKYPNYMSQERAIKEGMMWEQIKTEYIFKSCKLCQNNVQPVPATQIKNVTNSTSKTNVIIRKSLI